MRVYKITDIGPENDTVYIHEDGAVEFIDGTVSPGMTHPDEFLGTPRCVCVAMDMADRESTIVPLTNKYGPLEQYAIDFVQLEKAGILI